MRRYGLLVGLVVCFVFLIGEATIHAEGLGSDARIHKKFVLYPGKGKDDYVLYVPFEVTRPGIISVYHEMTYVDPKKHSSSPFFILADERVFEKSDKDAWQKLKEKTRDLIRYVPVIDAPLTGGEYFLKSLKSLLGQNEKPPAWYHGKRKLLEKSDRIRHVVDDEEIRKTNGRYVVILINNTSGEYHGNILISFPGDVWDVDPELEAKYERKPDLAIESITLDDYNRVVVTVANKGPGWLNKVRYRTDAEKVIRLKIFVDGKEALSVPIAEVDPKYDLVFKGKPVKYTTNIQIASPAKVMAIIDVDDVVAETDERNNKKRENLTPRDISEQGKRIKRGSGE